MQKFAVNLVGSLHKIAYAASAMISGVLEAFNIASPPSISTAAVAMGVAGHIALTPEVKNHEVLDLEAW